MLGFPAWEERRCKEHNEKGTRDARMSCQARKGSQISKIFTPRAWLNEIKST